MSNKLSNHSNVVGGARAPEHNPLAMLERGVQPISQLPRHRKSAIVGNLYFEYAQNVAALRGVVRSGRQIAEYLEAKGLIEWDRRTDRYTWKGEPLTRSEFLQMIRVAPAVANA